ncbi:MAG: hypothetical protein FWG30_12070 [Eubacteriaceae bacterium]|nr:hypothetical protein [Eubacteriaceae bacterium]
MERAYDFVEDLAEEILQFMEKEVNKLHPYELDLLVGLCKAHEGVCEFIELQEKFDEKPPMDGERAEPRERKSKKRSRY